MPYKVIDAHGHVNAPPQLYAYKSGLLASSGVHGQGSSGVTEELLAPIVKRHVEGTLDKVGTDVQFLSPRPFQLMHSERPAKIVDWWCKANNDAIAMSVKLAPDRYRGVCGLPQVWGESPRNCLEELERCVVEMGFVGCMIDPDPSEGQDLNMPTMENEYWYPLYEKMAELDVPALMHTAACKNPRESYSNHFITEESIQVLAIANSRLFEDFPNLKIIVCHGGGSIPYHIGRWRATRIRQRGVHGELRREHQEALLRHSAVQPGVVGAAVQDHRDGPVHVRDGEPRDGIGAGPGDGEVAGRHEAGDRGHLLADGGRQGERIRERRQGGAPTLQGLGSDSTHQGHFDKDEAHGRRTGSAAGEAGHVRRV